MRQLIDPSGRWVADAAVEVELAKKLYREMVYNRVFDTKAIALQRTGKLGTYASSLGQEAIGAGMGAAMRPSDILVPSYREYAAQFQRGVTICEILQYWSGDERSCCYAEASHPPAMDLPICVTIGAQAAHAVGVAYALKLEGKGQVAVCGLGDGATSKGDFYEGINAAAVWDLPVVYIVANNQYAISTPLAKQTASPELIAKADAVGMRAERVDGNDAMAVYVALNDALEHARATGPTLLEMMTYRMSDHTTADDASRYRSDDEVSSMWKKDPIARMKQLLVDYASWSKEDEESLMTGAREQVAEQVGRYLELPKQPLSEIFDHTYAELPPDLVAQKLSAEGGGHE